MPTCISLLALFRACVVAMDTSGRDFFGQGIARKGHYGAFLLSEPEVQLAVNQNPVPCPFGVSASA